MRRSPRASRLSVVPGCGMQSWISGHGAMNGAVPGTENGPTNVEFCGVAKSTWNFQRFKALDPGSIFIRKFGEPDGGAAPSRSAGKRLAYAFVSLKHTNFGALTPLNMATRSHAHASAPVKVLAPANRFHVT